MSIAPDWNENQKRLRETIKAPALFGEARGLFSDMHRSLHFSEGNNSPPTYMDKVWEGLAPAAFAVMPTEKDVTVAWNIWHITRIEDLTVNILINNADQILDTDWQARLHTDVTDTGNAMTDDEIIAFSKDVNLDALKQYRMAVGQNTREILRALTYDDMKRKVKAEGLEKIRREGGVTPHPDSVWLLDFWGKKDVAGIILMPVTRHQIGHLNDCMNLKKKINRL